MAELNIKNAQVSNLTGTLSDYSVDTVQTDGATGQKETEYQNTNWTQYFGYYTKIPELKKAIDAYAIWVVGRGYTADVETMTVLDGIVGWGEDTFNSILFNMIVTKKVNGDAFAEIIRDNDSGEIVNIKPLDPGSIKIVADEYGVVKRYEQVNKTKKVINKFNPEEILHLCNDRVADEIHGRSVVEACEWVILARNEAMTNYKTVLNRNIHPLKIWHLDTEDETKINSFVTKVENMVKDKENLFVPKGNVEVEIPPTSITDPLPWIKYLENFFYQAVGIPKIILGGSEEFTEASSKIAYLTFEQNYTREQKELEADLWNQLQLKISIDKPVSLKNEMLTSENKQPGYGVGFQPTEIMPGRNE